MNIDADATVFDYPRNARLVEWLFDHDFISTKTTSPRLAQEATAKALSSGELDAETFRALTAQGGTMSSSKSVADKLYATNGGSSVRVKDPSEKFSTKRYTGKHAKLGVPVLGSDGREVELPSERDNAKLGVLAKSLAARSLGNIVLEPHERALLDDMCANDTWCGDLNGEFYSEIKDAGSGQVKALLDDSTSGGIEIAPIEVDRQVVVFPLLSGELFPSIDLQEISRGRRIEGASIANVSMLSGQGDNTEVSLQSTASLISAIDTTIFGAAVAIEVGRDFMSDSIVSIGALLQQLIGAEFSRWLDEQIAIGDGTTEPEGLTVASGFASVTPDNTTSGPPTLEDYFDLHFGIDKQYRVPAFQPTFVSNDTTYARSRGIKVDTASPSTDQRPVIAPLTDIGSYRTLTWRHAIQNSIPNGTAIFGCLKKYRMYRRMGLALQVETGGKELARKNLALIIARARFGGQVIDANAFAKWTNGQS